MATQSAWQYRAGVNSVGSLDALPELQKAGFSLIRLPTTWDRAQKSSDGPITIPTDLDHQIKAFAKAGMAIVLDAHQSQWSKAFFAPAVGVPRWMYPKAKSDAERGGGDRDEAKMAFLLNTESFGGPPDPQGLWIKWLEALAKQYADEPAVVAIDLINEPGYGGSTKGKVPPSALADFYERAAAAVRKFRKGWPVVCENGTWTNLERDEQPFKTKDDWPAIKRGLIGSAHFYPSQPRRGETSDSKANRLLGILATESEIMDELGADLYIGEHAAFGATDKGLGDTPLHWDDWEKQTKKLSAWLKANKVAWSYWAWQQGAGPTLTDDNGHLRKDVLAAMAPAL